MLAAVVSLTRSHRTFLITLHLATSFLVEGDNLSLAELVLHHRRWTIYKPFRLLDGLATLRQPQILGLHRARSVLVMPVIKYGTQLVLQLDDLLIDFISFSFSHSALFTPVAFLFFTIMVLILEHLYLILQSMIFTSELLH